MGADAGRSRDRLDKVLVARGLETSRERAQARIMAGQVMVDQHRVDKPGTLVAADAEISLLGDQIAFVSRGGLKLEAALDHWQLDVTGLAAADIGASTGGFTDCLLQRGARSVLAIDVGYGQFAWKLRQDPRVELRERTNVRTLDPASLHAVAMLRPGGRILALVKPQFEVGKEKVGKGGVVRDPQLRREAVDAVRDFAVDSGLIFLGSLLSPVVGPKGNREYFLHLQVSN